MSRSEQLSRNFIESSAATALLEHAFACQEDVVVGCVSEDTVVTYVEWKMIAISIQN